MIGLDTDVVVRYHAQDDGDQSARAAAIIEGLSDADPGFLTTVTVVECYWVLSRSYRVSASDCCEILEGLLDAQHLVVEQAAIVRLAVRRARQGADFSDALIHELGRSAGCGETVTFDRRAGRHAGMRLLG